MARSFVVLNVSSGLLFCTFLKHQYLAICHDRFPLVFVYLLALLGIHVFFYPPVEGVLLLSLPGLTGALWICINSLENSKSHNDWSVWINYKNAKRIYRTAYSDGHKKTMNTNVDNRVQPIYNDAAELTKHSSDIRHTWILHQKHLRTPAYSEEYDDQMCEDNIN